MKNYQTVSNPKSLIGSYFETRDSKFCEKDFQIKDSFWASDNPKELCIDGYPDSLHMQYTLLPNTENKYNLERIHPYKIKE